MRSTWFCLALLAGCVLGCGNRNSFQQVTGVVTYQTAPVEGATVNFYNAETKTASYGRTDASGRFHLSTKATSDGAPPGSYVVTISKLQATGGEVKEIAPGVLDPNPTPGVTYHAIPPMYANQATSGLTATVTAGGKNDFEFHLK